MADLATVRADLPELPAALAEAWLLPLGEDWRTALAHRPLTEWQALRWHVDQVALDWESFSLPARRLLHTLLSVHVHGATGQNVAPDGKQRIGNAMMHLAQTGTLPGQVVLVTGEGGYDIADGAHRIAALLTHRRLWGAREHYPTQTEGWAELADNFPAWIGGIA